MGFAPRREGSAGQVMSMPIRRGEAGSGSEAGFDDDELMGRTCPFGVVVVVIVVTRDGGLAVAHPARTTRPAWCETLNSTAFAAPSLKQEAWLGAVPESQKGRLCGGAVREMRISDQGILAARWMKRYFKRFEARDMCRSGRRRKRVTDLWSSGRRVFRRGRLGSEEVERGLVLV